MRVRYLAPSILILLLPLLIWSPLSLSHAQPSHSSTLLPSLNSFDESSEPPSEGQTKAKEPAKTEVTSENEATFNNKTNIAEFFGRVTVKNDQFDLLCDHLVVILRKDRRGMEHGEAIGNVVITQDNVDADGKVTRSVGRAGRASYNPYTGDVVLTDWPQLQQGINNHIAVDKNTRMTLNKDGQSTTVGHSRTIIVDTQKQTSPSR